MKFQAATFKFSLKFMLVFYELECKHVYTNKVKYNVYLRFLTSFNQFFALK